ncbi:hypothetical protein HRR83_005948 [Exophiala dermatitidis]|nr:hypothetical protein HRR74_008077 [Exophiala dermatitidis]KAJ4552401.1 hypothetical protein HRR77_002414 [Exophiala dermatitidis]KAJ4579091.1 hypothetical protein HRR81_003242 [Exophiala dermatitidis]KAJ4594178.1 hypothetical protein HRR83_005948 [Exophiala dermatitidis]KAJ4603894.1 hypothetical protein HRR85_008188 [Exophiala dermatitidis]
MSQYMHDDEDDDELTLGQAQDKICCVFAICCALLRLGRKPLNKAALVRQVELEDEEGILRDSKCWWAVTWKGGSIREEEFLLLALLYKFKVGTQCPNMLFVAADGTGLLVYSMVGFGVL